MYLQKNVKNTIHLELLMPLFKKSFKVFEETELRVLESNNPQEKVSRKDINSVDLDQHITTDRKEWSNNLTYSSVLLKPLENNLRVYRDTFRSRINVQIVSTKASFFQTYILLLLNMSVNFKILRSTKTRTKKNKNKVDSKKKNTTNKNKQLKTSTKIKSKSSSKKSEKFTKEQNKVKASSEITLQKVKLCEFFCDMYIPTWKQDDITFFWSAEPFFGKQAIEFHIYQKVI